MLENVKIYSQIAAKSFLKWLLLIATGFLITIILFTIALVQNWNLTGEHGYIIALLTSNWAAFLLIIGLPLYLFLYVMIANKYSMQSIIFLVWKNKAEEFAAEKIKLVVDKIMAKNNSVNTVTNATILKLQLLEENRRSPDSSKIKRKAVDYIIKKIKLNDIDYSNKDLRLADIVANKVNNYISETAEPSLQLFWILVAIQFILFIMTQFL